MENVVEVVSWFDDRFYKVILDDLSIKGIQEKVKRINPKYELLVLPSDKNGYSHIFLPSSTTIEGSAPKDWLSKWRGQVGNWEADRIMNEKAERGTRIHHAFTMFQQGVWIVFNNPKAPRYSQAEIENMKAESPNGVHILTDQEDMLQTYRLVRMFGILKPKVIANEMTIYNSKEGYAGTLDHLWLLEKGTYDFGDKVTYEIPETGNYVLDLKTGAEDEQNYPEQIASYCAACLTLGIDVKGGILIYSNSQNKKGIEGLKLEQYDLNAMEYYYDAFLDQYKVWLRKAVKNPRVFDLPSLLKLN
ncbi:hypothetical protein [Immundisolibacter sp.]